MFNSGCNLLKMLRTAQLAASAPLVSRLFLRQFSRSQASRVLRMFSQSSEAKPFHRNRDESPNKREKQRYRTSIQDTLMQLRAMGAYDGYGPEEYASIINCMMDVLEETDKNTVDKVQPVFKALPHSLLESNFAKVAERIPTFGKLGVTRVDKDVSHQKDRPKVQDLALLRQAPAQESFASAFLQSRTKGAGT